MSAVRHSLQGRCSCGRNRYTVAVPVGPLESASIFFDNSAATRRAHSAPLAVYLQIPLRWYHSATFAYFPDETHASIRRVYALSSLTATEGVAIAPEQAQQRHFCGYCGTHFARWTEAECENIGVAVESLRERDVQRLGEWGLMPTDYETERVDVRAAVEDEEEKDDLMASSVPRRPDGQPVVSARHAGGRGAPWFEEMVGDSFLAQIRRQGETGAGMDWEVVEIEGRGLEEPAAVGAKRKFGEGDDDAEVTRPE